MGKPAIDLTGRSFGRMTVVSSAPTRVYASGKSVRYWLCRCECGTEVEKAVSEVNRASETISCGCVRKPAHNRKDLTGQVFGNLTAVGPAEPRQQYGTVVSYWICRCKCGKEMEVPTGNLTSGNSRSCGCRTDEWRQSQSAAKFRHGHTVHNSPTYRSWMGMLKRCRDDRPRYGGRGITYDPRWESFENFLADMGERPEGCTIDRIDNDGPYSPSNCRWADHLTQGNNRGNHRWVTYQGRTQTIAQWARELGMKRGVLYNRIMIYKWPLARAMQP